MKNRVENRIKVIAEGMSVLVEAFGIPKTKIVDQIDEAIDRFDEFWNLLSENVADDEEEQNDEIPEEDGEIENNPN